MADGLPCSRSYAIGKEMLPHRRFQIRRCEVDMDRSCGDGVLMVSVACGRRRPPLSRTGQSHPPRVRSRGGSNDVVGRCCRQLSTLPEPVIVENVGGAGGLSAGMAAKARQMATRSFSISRLRFIPRFQAALRSCTHSRPFNARRGPVVSPSPRIPGHVLQDFSAREV